MKTISGINIVPGGTESPTMYDIGYALSQVPRFCGHTKEPWTVLQHLFAAARLAKLLGHSTRIQLLALLHDAHEAITGDIPHPWKTDDLRKYQDELDTRIYASIGISLPSISEKKTVKEIDTMLLYAEAKVFGAKSTPHETNSLACRAVNLTNAYLNGISPQEGGKLFQKIYEALNGKQSNKKRTITN